MHYKIVIAIVLVVLFLIVLAGVLFYASRSGTSSEQVLPVELVPYLVASPGTGANDSMPFLSGGSKVADNPRFDPTSPYLDLITIPISNPGKFRNLEYDKLTAYFQAVYYLCDPEKLKNMNFRQLLGWYRSQVFYYTAANQPDGGWNGPYWSNRILSGVNHDSPSGTGCTSTSAFRNESFLFDQIMFGGNAKDHDNLWGNRIFTEPLQATLRNGMRNSEIVLRDRPSWSSDGKPVSQFGYGGFPSDVYLEMLQFPQEHPYTKLDQYTCGMGYPTGCQAEKMYFDLKAPDSGQTVIWCQDFYDGYPCDGSTQMSGKPLFQPQDIDKMPRYPSTKPVWFYFSQGLGQFWNIGRTAYCYSYMDAFLNAPNGVGWAQMYPGPDKGGMLGLTKNGDPKEHNNDDPVYSMKLILEYLSRVGYRGSCTDTDGTQYPAAKDQRTQLDGLGYCAAPCTACQCAASTPCTQGDADCPCLGETGGECTGASITTYKYSPDKQVAAIMGQTSYWDPYTTSCGSWANSCIPTYQNPTYPSRTSPAQIKDNRFIVTGWVNGHFYGYPPGNCLCTEGQYAQSCFKEPSGLGQKNSCGSGPCNPFRQGIPGTDPATGKIIYGKHFTSDDPLVYYNRNGKELYSTYYGKPLTLDEETALELVAEMYSRGDTGFENFQYNWPFGTYFGYGQDLGSPGKNLVKQLSAIPYSIQSLQFTMTPTSFSTSQTQPAYDFEILYLPIASGPNGPATCASAVSLDLTADFTSSTPGRDIRRLANVNKGSTGGFVPVNSPAGKSARAFDGTHQGLSNFTTLGSGDSCYYSFDPTKANTFSGKTNML